MMTAHFTRDSDEWRRAREAGAAALLEKPFRDVNLVTLQVRQLIDARRVRHERDVLRQAISRRRALPASSAAAGRCSTSSGWSRPSAAPTAPF